MLLLEKSALDMPTLMQRVEELFDRLGEAMFITMLNLVPLDLLW